jgi:hypothetical protein
VAYRIGTKPLRLPAPPEAPEKGQHVDLEILLASSRSHPLGFFSVPISTAGVVDALRSWRFQLHREEQLRDGIAEVLTRAKIPFSREHWLCKQDKIDFLVDGHVGLEAKLYTSTTAMTRQLHRYAQHAVLDELILVTASMRLEATMPGELNGKPLVVFTLVSSIFGI